MSPKAGVLEGRLLNWAVTALMSFTTVVASYATTIIRDVNVNIEKLNEKVASVIADSSNKDYRLQRLETDMYDLKRKVSP